MLRKILVSSWLLPLLLFLAVLAAAVLESELLQLPEGALFDRLTALRSPAAAPVVLVEVDNESLAAVGPWPWPRAVLADLLQQVAAAGARTVALHPPLQGREANPGLSALRVLAGTLRTASPSPDPTLLDRLEQSVDEADGDRRLAAVLQGSGRVILALDWRPSPGNAGTSGEMPEWLRRAPPLPQGTGRQEITLGDLRLPWPVRPLSHLVVVPGFLPPPAAVGAAASLAHTRLIPDPDGVVRHLPLAVEVGGRALPALPLALAAGWAGEAPQWERHADRFTGVRLGGREIPTDSAFRLLSSFDPGEGLQRLSAARVLAGDVPKEALSGRAVVVGLTADGAPLRDLPRRPEVPEAEIAALAAASILGGDPLYRPHWAAPLEAAVLLYLGFFLIVILPRISARVGLLILGVFLLTWWGSAVFLLVHQGIWLHLVPSLLLVIPGYVLAQLRRALSRRRAENLELYKMLGLSFQGQGMLDMALENFSKCPVADLSVRELLYNLGLDFERKRMRNKAVSVYRRILQAGNFRDVRERIARLDELEGTVILGAGRSAPVLVAGKSAARPTLGRYEILRELGQGAMGTVYLGRDPRINREVALKTVRYGDLEEGALAEAKERFFREAEAAGKLNHPNIVTIHDAGEDHDLAYLAMEVLAGRSLVEHCRKDNLLPAKQVVGIVAQVADALDYAHRHQVVHRDIKPANIMLLDSGQVKVTDFGIARIMSDSGTRTGTILGTPSYMSPEQVAGKKVDGRSDLFSLGGVFYELLTGAKPFQGESIAALMYNIANASPAPVPRGTKVPASCRRIVKKLLARDLGKRYRTAAEVAADLRQSLERLA